MKPKYLGFRTYRQGPLVINTWFYSRTSKDVAAGLDAQESLSAFMQDLLASAHRLIPRDHAFASPCAARPLAWDGIPRDPAARRSRDHRRQVNPVQ